MNRWKWMAAALAVFGGVSTAGASSVLLYAGTLDDNSELLTTGDWAIPATSLHWELFWNAQDELYTYQYTLTVPASGKGISHFTLETSDDLGQDPEFETRGDFGYVLQGPGEVKANNGSPFMPGTIDGVKFDDITDDPRGIVARIVTARDPVLGDFYAKGGRDSTVRNAGFLSGGPDGDGYTLDLLSFDPTDFPGHLLVPNHTSDGPPEEPDDPQGVPPLMPEPLTAMAVLASLGGLGGYIRRRRR
jgi:hypothetical protein